MKAEQIIKVLFDLPASVVIICGQWKTGKTDFSLLIAEMLFQIKGHYLPIVKCATNIQTRGNEKIEYITDMMALKRWLWKDHESKLYIYDEAIARTPSRKAMSKLNTQWLEVIPELSKGKARLIVILQEIDYADSIFNHPTFLRGIFKKVSRKRAYCFSHLLKSYIGQGNIEIENIPRCQVHFFPYRIAEFRLGVEQLPFEFNDKETEILWKWSNGETAQSLGLHTMQMNRMSKRFIKKALEKSVTQQLNTHEEAKVQ